MQSTNNVVRGCGFHHVAIRTFEWEKSLAFWTQGLGFVPKIQWGEAPARACMLDIGDGNYLEIFERETTKITVETPAVGHEESPILHFCFRADSCDEAVERARAAGGVITVEPKYPAPFGVIGITAKIAFVQGPSGEICEFFECAQL